jgi:hypothetical protein
MKKIERSFCGNVFSLFDYLIVVQNLIKGVHFMNNRLAYDYRSGKKEERDETDLLGMLKELV